MRNVTRLMLPALALGAAMMVVGCEQSDTSTTPAPSTPTTPTTPAPAPTAATTGPSASDAIRSGAQDVAGAVQTGAGNAAAAGASATQKVGDAMTTPTTGPAAP